MPCEYIFVVFAYSVPIPEDEGHVLCSTATITSYIEQLQNQPRSCIVNHGNSTVHSIHTRTVIWHSGASVHGTDTRAVCAGIYEKFYVMLLIRDAR
jgi:hypothetical protein